MTLTVEVVRTPTRPPPGEKPYGRFGPVILEFFRYRGRESVLEGPADTGKSRACLELLHAAMEKYPGARGAMIRKTRKSLTTTAMETYEKWVRPEGASRLWGEQEYRYPNGSKIYLLGMDDPEKVKSLEADLVYVQEVSELNEDDWEILTTRVTGRGAVMPYTRLFADMNPTDPAFHLYAREAAGKVRFFQVRHADNPTVTPERIAALADLTGYRRDRLFLGLRVSAEGRYFEEWDPEEHVVEPFKVPAHWVRWTAVDYGFAAPFCALFFARNPSTRVVYVTRELYAPGLRDTQQADLITARIAQERAGLKIPEDARLYVRHAADPSMFAKRNESGQPSIADEYARRGVRLFPAPNNRRNGWATVRRALAEKRLRVFATCANLIRTLPAMVVDPLDPEDLADEVKGVKTEDHAVDALRYGLMVEGMPGRGGAREVRIGG